MWKVNVKCLPAVPGPCLTNGPVIAGVTHSSSVTPGVMSAWGEGATEGRVLNKDSLMNLTSTYKGMFLKAQQC